MHAMRISAHTRSHANINLLIEVARECQFAEAGRKQREAEEERVQHTGALAWRYNIFTSILYIIIFFISLFMGLC